MKSSIHNISWRVIALALTLFLGASTHLRAATAQGELTSEALQDLRYGATQDLNAYLAGGDYRDSYGDLGAGGDDVFGDGGDVFSENKRLSPVKAALMSLVVPGAGQWYAKSHPAKIGVFLAAEGLFWLKYKSYHDDANAQITQFEAYADEHWSEAEYWRYILEVYGVTDDTNLNEFTHHLPDTKTQQYYEMIGKYNQFSYGWAQPDSIQPYSPLDHRYDNAVFASSYRPIYNAMRGRANDLFSDRDRMLAFIAVNHIVSAIDAALAAKRYNREQDPMPNRLSVTPTVRPGENWSIVPYLDVTLRF